MLGGQLVLQLPPVRAVGHVDQFAERRVQQTPHRTVDGNFGTRYGRLEEAGIGVLALGRLGVVPRMPLIAGVLEERLAAPRIRKPSALAIGGLGQRVRALVPGRVERAVICGLPETIVGWGKNFVQRLMWDRTACESDPENVWARGCSSIRPTPYKKSNLPRNCKTCVPCPIHGSDQNNAISRTKFRGSHCVGSYRDPGTSTIAESAEEWNSFLALPSTLPVVR